jgi:hypothetical protein
MNMLTTYSQLAGFAPRLKDCEESEPTLLRVITFYYMQVFDPNEARELATEYIQALKEQINA